MKIETIINRLKSLGYTYDETNDKFVIEEFLMPKVKNHILLATNQSSITKELQKIAVDRVCGEFLLAKKNTGQLDISVDEALASFTEGDFSINMGNNAQSADSKLDALIDYLINSGERDLICQRKLQW